MGLATEHTPGIWTISPRAEPMLRELGTRGDIIKTMHQALDREGLAEQRAYVSGKLVGSTQIASGRFAMIDNGLGFQLVPWSDPLEKRLGQHISGVAMSGGGVDWTFGRSRGLGL